MPAPAHFRNSVLVLGACAVAACSGGLKPSGAKNSYRGAMEIYLEPIAAESEPTGACSATFALRNLSGARQGAAGIRVAWFDSGESRLAEQSLRMDPTDVGQLDAKNLVVPVSCDRVDSARIASAQWTLGWDMGSSTIVDIADVAETDWSFRWDEGLGMFVGARSGG